MRGRGDRRPRRGGLLAGFLLAGLVAAPAAASVLAAPQDCRLVPVGTVRSEGTPRIEADRPSFYTGPDFNVGDVERFTFTFRLLGQWPSPEAHRRPVVVVALNDLKDPLCFGTTALLPHPAGYRFEVDLLGRRVGEASLEASITMWNVPSNLSLPHPHYTATIRRKVEEPVTWRLEVPVDDILHGNEAILELWATVRTTAPVWLEERAITTTSTRIETEGTVFRSPLRGLRGAENTPASYDRRVAVAKVRHDRGCRYDPPHQPRVFDFEAHGIVVVHLVDWLGKRTEFVSRTKLPRTLRDRGLTPDCPYGTTYSPAACDCVSSAATVGEVDWQPEGRYELVGGQLIAVGGGAGDPASDPFLPETVDRLASTGGARPPHGPPGRPEEPPDPPDGPQLADLEVRKAGPAVAEAGQVITYTLTVINHGPSAARSALLEDILPNGVVFVGATAGCSFDEAAGAGGSVTCTLDLPVDEMLRRDIQVRVPSEDGTIVNTAHVRSDLVDENPSNNTASLETEVTPPPEEEDHTCALGVEPGSYAGDGGCGCEQGTVSCADASRLHFQSPGCDLSCVQSGNAADCGSGNVIFDQGSHTCRFTTRGGRLLLDCTNPAGGACQERF